MAEQLIGTLENEGWAAEIYSTSLPGEFEVVYRNASGNEVERVPLTGVSSYHQREDDILTRLEQLKSGEGLGRAPELDDSGEY